MSADRPVDRDTVVSLLATFHNRAPGAVGERIGSLELTWLIHAAEQHYGICLDLSDAQLELMETVTGATAVLAESIGGAADGQ
ncbi:acyl carrier protein [Streptacidiphilus sp. EB129]|uniref:acyl carrier protein n=1 Tax=Streptacidiphilus sp. EB129 TaxID=3156262 RepID=UPI00351641D2